MAVEARGQERGDFHSRSALRKSSSYPHPSSCPCFPLWMSPTGSSATGTADERSPPPQRWPFNQRCHTNPSLQTFFMETVDSTLEAKFSSSSWPRWHLLSPRGTCPHTRVSRSTSALLTLGARSFFAVGGCAGWISQQLQDAYGSPGLFPLDAIGALCSSVNQICPQTLPNVPWGQRHLRILAAQCYQPWLRIRTSGFQTSRCPGHAPTSDMRTSRSGARGS